MNIQLLLLTRYITPQMAEILKNEGIQFMDTAGNGYINQFPLYVFVKGNKPPEIFIQTRNKRIFTPTGIKMVYAFLGYPRLVNKPYRQIAEVAGVALGTVGWVMRDLREMGYLRYLGKRGYQLTRKDELFTRWCNEYREKLRLKLLRGRFKCPQHWWQKKALNPEIAQWGGEVAAAKLTEYLKPGIITIYIEPDRMNVLIAENRLKRDDEGDVELLERFWEPLEGKEQKDIVHPILVYADLIGTARQRNIETARMIYEKYITGYLRED